MATNSIPPPPPTSGNVQYLAIAGVLGAAVIGLLVWRFSGSSTPSTQPTAAPSLPASVTNPSQVHDQQNVPPPPSADDADAGEVDAGKVTSAPQGIAGCEVKTCNGRAGADLEAALRSRAATTRRKCYEPALQHDETLQGHVSVKLHIAASGAVCSSTVGSNDMSNASVASCTAASFSGMRVPAPSGGCVDIALPVSFSPGH